MSGSGTAALANEQETTQEDSPTIFVEWPELGVDFVHRADTHKQYSLPRTIGSGTAVFDYNGDGLLDLYLIQNSGAESKHTNRLYRLGADLRYVDVSSGSGLDVAGYGMGAAAGDVNNDGRVDLLLTEYGHARLFRNRSEGDEPKFEEITAAAGIENPYWGTSAAFLDFDRDGWLDLVVVNYMNYDPSRWCADGSSREEFCGPDAFPGRMAKLYRNRGAQPDDQVRFEDVTVSSGLAAAPGPGLGIFCADFDGDRWPDMFIANDGQPNHLWINQRDGRFVEEGISRGLAYNAMGKAEANMGVAVGDVDGDNLFDLYVTHLTEETHTLWRQEPRGYFLDRTAASKLIGAASRSTGFGTAMADVDNDGDLDLMLVNGRVTRAAKPPASPARYANEFWLPYAEPNQLLLNTGDGHFVNAASQNPAYCREPAVSRGLAVADLNDDGGLDLIVTRVDQPPGIYRNVHPARGHWLLVRVVDSLLHRDAYGAEVTLRQGEKVVTRHVNPGYSFLCSNDPRCHFGLGDAAAYAAIEVVWPDGTAEMFAGGKADQVITLERGAGRPLEQ
ncbi:MAG: CRTAC1 family protein [Planctomycetia bacterium]|nr:CRTAC1 family protein [Planctomycetia bacterium]